MRYGGAWVGAWVGHWLTRGMGDRAWLNPHSTRYGGASVWWQTLALFFWPYTVRHVTLPPRPTPGLKAKPQGATPQPKPTRGGALGFLPQPAPKPPPHTPRPKLT
ncbi:hypothetical protein Hanom_Chr02g00158691 [Helianthus anomalus]